MASPFLRVGRLSEQRLRMESSFGFFRGKPSIVNCSTKAGDPKKPIRYTSIKKSKPKTITDIGKLLLQRSSEAKESKQSVIADAALKAAAQTTKPPALKHSSASDDSTASVTAKHPTVSSSAAESVTPIAAIGEWRKATRYVVNSPANISEEPLAEFSSPVEGLYKSTTSGGQGVCPEYVNEETADTKNIPMEVPASSELSHPLSSTSVREKPERTPSISNYDPDNIASTSTVTLETSSNVAPIDLTYSEEGASISDVAVNASTEPLVGVLSALGTVTTEVVSPQSVSAVLSTPEVLLPDYSLPRHGSTETSLVHEDVGVFHSLEKVTSKPSSTSELPTSKAEITQTCMQDVGPINPETPTDLACSVSSSNIHSEGGTVVQEITPGVKNASDFVPKFTVTEPEVTYKDNGTQEDASKKMLSTEDAIISGVTPTEKSGLQSKSGNSSSQAEETVAMPEKVLEHAPGTINGVSMVQSPANNEFAEKELKPEGEWAIKSSEAQLDPIQRLFLEKIREYYTRSKAHDGLVDAGPEYERAFSEELTKLQRLYGNGDLTAFPEFKYPEPVLDESSSK